MNKRIAFICFITTLLIYGAQGSYTPYLSSYYQLNGISKLHIGLMSSIGPIVAITIQPLWGYLSDKTGKRKRILQILSLSAAMVMLLYFINNSPFTLVVASFLYSSFAMAIIPLANAVITRASVKYDFDYARVRIGGPIGHSLMPLLVSFLLGFYNKAMFVVAIVLYFVLFIAITLMPDEMFEYVSDRKTDTRGRIFDNYEIYYLFALCVLNTFGNSILWTYIGPKVVDMGYSQSIIGILTFVLSLGELPVLMFIKRITRNFRTINVMNFAVTISMIRLLLASSNSIILIFLCQFIEGLTYMVAFYTAVTYITKHCRPEKVSSAQTILVTLESGVGAVLANLLGAYIINNLGIDISFRLISAGMMIIMILINVLLMIRNSKEGKHEQL